jgi:hypothetical protein
MKRTAKNGTKKQNYFQMKPSMIEFITQGNENSEVPSVLKLKIIFR